MQKSGKEKVEILAYLFRVPYHCPMKNIFARARRTLARTPVSFLDIIRQNKVWFICFLLFLVIGGIMLLRSQVGDAIFFFSRNRSPFGNFFFTWFTKVGEHATYVFLVIFFLFIRFRYSVLLAVTGITVMIVSFLSKGFFLHDRPKLFFEKLGNTDAVTLVEGVYQVTRQTSFPSGHTMSGFALFGMLAFILRGQKVMGFICFLTALLIGISRIYLVQHFLKDVYVGAIFGVAIALLLFWLHSALPKNENRWYDRRFLLKKRVP